MKTATLMEEAPPKMQEHLRLRSEEIVTDYKKVMQAIEGCSKGTSKGKGKSDKGKGQPKGKGRNKGKGKGKAHESKSKESSKSDRKCFVCGSPSSHSE